MTYKILWYPAKAVLKGKIIAMSSCIKKIERSQVNDLMLHLRLLKNKNKLNPKQTGQK
jgi:hypothetical protein